MQGRAWCNTPLLSSVQAWKATGNQAVADMTEGRVSPGTAAMRHYMEAYPEAVQLMTEIEQAWCSSVLEVFLVPQTSIGECKQAPQVGSWALKPSGRGKLAEHHRVLPFAC